MSVDINREQWLVDCIKKLNKIEHEIANSQEPHALSSQRSRLTAIEHQLSAIRALQAEDRLRQFVYKGLFGVGGIVIGAVITTFIK